MSIVNIISTAIDSDVACDATLTAATKATHLDVSFIVAAFNVAPYIEAAVRSALQQTGVEVEVIIVDDASNDDTGDTVVALAERDPRVILVRRDKTAGPSVARNEAIERAKGTWLAILDGDDLIAPERSRCLIDLAESVSADLVADNFERFYSGARYTGSTMIPRGEQPYSFLVDVASFINTNITFRKTNFSLGAVKPMFRTDFVRSRDIRYKDDLPVGEDYHMCLACLQAGARFVVTSNSYYKYRVRQRSQSWRLSQVHVERLLQAHTDAGVEARFGGDADVAAAAKNYVRALESARIFLQIVDQAKRREVRKALYATLLQPDAWPLVARFGLEALVKRARRLT